MELLKNPRAPSTSVADGVYAQVYLSVMQDRTTLPTLPDLAIRIRSAMRDPNYDVNSITRVVQTDAAVTAYLLRVANSPMYLTRRPISDARTAISRFGIEATANMVTAYTLKSLYTIPSPALRAVQREVWQQSARIAAICAVLARRCGFNPDEAMLAGLMQNMGALPLLNALARRRELCGDKVRVRETLKQFSPKVGALLLGHWGFEETFVEVARCRGDFMRAGNGKADLADLAVLAELHTLVGTPAMHECPRINEIPAFSRLPVGELTPASSLAILEEAREDLSNVARMLSG